MFPNNIVRLWNDNMHISSVREAIADTLILALDMKKVFTEDQFNYAFEFFEDISDKNLKSLIIYRMIDDSKSFKAFCNKIQSISAFILIPYVDERFLNSL